MYKINENLYQSFLPENNDKNIEIFVSLLSPQELKIDTFFPNILSKIWFPLEDANFPGVKWLNTVVSVVEPLVKTNTVCIYCRGGISRSVMVTAAVLMKKEYLSCDQALEKIAKVNSTIDPNPRFIKGLKEYHKELLNKV